MSNVIAALEERGFIEAFTSDEIREITKKPIKVYCGFDPTADSLHLGNLVAIMGLAWFQRFGHTPVAIVGGATGMIGDPSGKTSERQFLDEGMIQNNLKGIQKNLEQILHQGAIPPILLNNYSWLKEFSLIAFLRDVGKHFRMGPMLSKDSVKKRLESEEGMSFTEFCYQLLQGYDFLHLYRDYDVLVQLGGSDQWGNIIAGTDLIRKVLGKSAFGLTFPLLTKSDGQKFGKSEKGAIWLSPEKLSPYEFYQYLFRTADADVIALMRMLTFMEMEEIRHYERLMKKEDYIPNTAQRKLAEEVTKIVHGSDSLKVALEVTKAASPGAKSRLDAATLDALGKDMPNFSLTREEIVGVKLIDLIPKLGLISSKSEARKLIRNGGMYLNNEKVQSEDATIEEENLIGGRLALLALGKKNKALLKVE